MTTPEPCKAALTGVVTHIEIDVSADELDAIAPRRQDFHGHRMRRRLAERVLAAIYADAEAEDLIATEGDLIEYHDGYGNTRYGRFVQRSEPRCVVLSNDDGGTVTVPAYRIHGIAFA